MQSHVIGVTRACLHRPQVVAQQQINRRALSSRIPLSWVNQGRRGGASQYIPEVAVRDMYSKGSAASSRFGGVVLPRVNTSSIMGRRFASEMSVHRTKYAAVVVGGGPAGITVCFEIV